MSTERTIAAVDQLSPLAVLNEIISQVGEKIARFIQSEPVQKVASLIEKYLGAVAPLAVDQACESAGVDGETRALVRNVVDAYPPARVRGAPQVLLVVCEKGIDGLQEEQFQHLMGALKKVPSACWYLGTQLQKVNSPPSLPETATDCRPAPKSGPGDAPALPGLRLTLIKSELRIHALLDHQALQDWEIADRLGVRDPSSIRRMIRRMKKKGYQILTVRGRGYYRLDAPPPDMVIAPASPEARVSRR